MDMSLELRARAAVAVLELAFNPHQRRDSRGRWVKMPDSELKRPRRSPRGGAVDAGSPRASDWMAEIRKLPRRLFEEGELSPSIRRRVGQLFAFEDPQSGFKAEVTKLEGTGNAGDTGDRDLSILTARVRITGPDGREVGTATRQISIDPRTGKPEIYHAAFHLLGSAQGTGFSSRWLRDMEQRYRDAGISRIRVYTEKVGGYAWAKAGFDFKDAKAARSIANKFKAKLKLKANRDMPQRLRTDTEELIRRAESRRPSDRPLPVEFAMLGWEPGAATWLGKETMLNTGWEGVKGL